ncbi:sulfatase-like hydrolase/transferase [Cupriavidus sp. D39]|uniref:sulfatase-like hydrolase/transferase n=1 Tax=Cupriavidus sp. D39 TaxID=2997877 RepID=UPI00226FD15C|nr:sulfatase-like hydrolase/transferase [Cupriavidus sp. D39]MCY0854090.1 sulfatase-like hydrolase/transferase [Cupriavidus sp. D39]
MKVNARNSMMSSGAASTGPQRWMRRAAALLLALQAGLLHAQAHQDKPNILWITVEDITTFIGAYGDSQARTPNIDQLAREGVLYTHAYQAAGVCAPARAAMITGMYPTSVGAHHMRTLSGELSSAGDGAKSKPPAFRRSIRWCCRSRSRPSRNTCARRATTPPTTKSRITSSKRR